MMIVYPRGGDRSQPTAYGIEQHVVALRFDDGQPLRAEDTVVKNVPATGS